MTYLFTSESVSEGHPDKIADAISDAVLDYVLEDCNPATRCACETLVTTNQVILAGEYKKSRFDRLTVDDLVRNTIREIHKNHPQNNFHQDTVKITNLMHGQSADIALGTDNFGAGDQGLMFGHACGDNSTGYMPLAIYWSHAILKHLAYKRKVGGLDWLLGADAKAQVTFEYNDDGTPIRITKVVCSSQQLSFSGQEEFPIDSFRDRVKEAILEILPESFITDETEFLINPTGRFVTGGPDGDTGLTGRKIIVDTYGGYAPHGGGAFSGKDPTKVDRSAAYMMRYIAKNIVGSHQATRATCQVSYAIGVKEPMSFYIDSDGDNQRLTKWVKDNIDLTPLGIINHLNLFRPIYSQTTNYGHFGKSEMPWERLDLF